jgi:hypothetical protein
MISFLMKYIRLFLFTITCSCFTWACTYNNEEELYKALNGCDTTDISYNLDVLPILQNNCYTCHNQTSLEGGINLEGYARVKSIAQNGRLVGAISHSPGFAHMPKNASKLPSCDISKISRWVEAGMPEN